MIEVIKVILESFIVLRQITSSFRRFISKPLEESKHLNIVLDDLQVGVSYLRRSLQNPLDENQRRSNLKDTDSPVSAAIVLVNSLDSSKIQSIDDYNSARSYFRRARKKATSVFCDPSLPIELRIQAAQIRNVARILGSPQGCQSQEVNVCLGYLQQLYKVKDVQEIFSVLTVGGLKSWCNRAKILKNASAVHVTNQISFDIARKFMKEQPSILEWYKISFGERNYHPMFGYERVVKDSGVKVVPSSVSVTFDGNVTLGCSVVNSKGEIIANILGNNSFEIFERSKENRKLCDSPMKEEARECKVRAVDVDKEDNIHIITASKNCNDEVISKWSFQLLIFDANGNKKLECSLPFRQKCFTSAVSMAISKGGKIAILDRVNNMVYIGSTNTNAYKVEKGFHVPEVPLRLHFLSRSIRFSYFDGIKIIVLGWHTVYIYSENGDLEQDFKLPEEYGAGVSLEINHVTQRILIGTWSPLQFPRYNLLQFSKIGELLDNFMVGTFDKYQHPALTSHLNGSVVLSGEKQGAYLQLQKNAQDGDDSMQC